MIKLNVIEHIFQDIQKKELFRRGQILLLAVSGGLDSIVLLDVFSKLCHRLGVRLHIIHFDHNLRTESAQDAEFVNSLSQKYGIPITLGRRKGRSLAHLSEEQSRTLRMEFCVEVARKLKIATIVTAHHKNDVAETVLMRMIRGCGLSGLGALKTKGDWLGIPVIRPLLSLHRTELEHYSKKQKLIFREDKSNLNKDFLRNRIRLQMLPLLQRNYNPQIMSVLSTLAQSVDTDYEYLLQQAYIAFKKTTQVKLNSVVIRIAKLHLAHISIQRMIIRLSLKQLCGDLHVFTFDHIERILEISQAKQAQENDFPRGIKIRKIKDSLFIEL